MRPSLGEKCAVVLVTLVSGGVLLTLGLRQFVGYDSFWHVFIARQETWELLMQEIQSNAHPPLYYLALRAAMALFGHHALAYRAVSLLSVLLGIYLVVRVVGRVTAHRQLAVVAGAAWGLSFNVIDIGLEVRAYALSLAFSLAAFSAYLDWLGTNPARLPMHRRLVFAVTLSAAMLTHYATFFFIAAATLAPPLLMVLHRRWRLRVAAEFRHHLPALAAMFGVPLLAGGAAFWLHARHWGGGLAHLPEYLYDPSIETPVAFLVRATRNLITLFVPQAGSENVALVFLVVMSVAAMAMSARRTMRGSLAVVPPILLIAMLALNAGAAFVQRYPYGGASRHAVFLFPVALVTAFALYEGLRRAGPAWAASSRLGWAAVAAVGVAISFGSWRTHYRVGPPFMEAQLETFRARFGQPDAALVDQFNFVVMFGHYHDWTWHNVSQDKSGNVWQVWEVSRGQHRFKVCRARAWLLDLSTAEPFVDIAECLNQTQAESVTVFRAQEPGQVPAWQVEAAPDLARRFAPPMGLRPTEVVVQGEAVYARFTREAWAQPDAGDVCEPIEVQTATYGGNCTSAAEGNATADVRRACSGRALCIYPVDRRTLGDPKPDCAKKFEVAWTCGDGTARRELKVSPEAGFGSPAVLRCVP